MLTIYDVPEEILHLHKESKALADEIIQFLAMQEFTSVKHGTELLSTYADSVIIIIKGIFKTFYDHKFLRFYTACEIVSTEEMKKLPVEIVGEMASQIIAISKNDFYEKISSNKEAQSKWGQYCQLQIGIYLGVCSSFISKEYKPVINIKTYPPGAVIISEGDAPGCIFEMIDGTAVVSIQSTEVGAIHTGEIFGEVGFLTGTSRTASVIARSQCMVQYMNVDDIDQMLRMRPKMIYNISKTIAKRLIDVNDRLVRIQTLT
jgi:hypothetical protein